MSDEKTPSWKSFLFAICGAYVVSCALLLEGNPHIDRSASVVMAIWGVSFWAGGIGNLFVDRKLERKKP